MPYFNAIMLVAESSDGPWLNWSVSAAWAMTYFLALLSMPSVLIKRRGRPQAALAWMLVLFLLPVVGLVFWWAIGRRQLDRKRRKRRLATGRRTDRLATLRDELPTPPEADWDLLSVKRLPAEEAEWVFPPTRGNRAKLLIDADQVYPAMENAIASANHTLHALFYIWNADTTGRRFRDMLVARAKDGIEVRVLFDAIGGSAVRGKFMHPLVDAGAKVAAFRPPKLIRRSLELNFRNHRKIMIADGCEAFVGGLNIGDEYRENWRDTAVQLHGPLVDQLQEIFADDWFFATGESFAGNRYFGAWCEDQTPLQGRAAICGVVASGPHTRINLTHQAFFISITRASNRVWLTTPYFIPDQVILTALRTAVFRGVDVRIVVPAMGDRRLVTWAARSFYPELLRAGVRIFEHDGSFLHAKTALIDEDLSIIGSANMDIRSFRLNFEVSCFLKSIEFANDLTRLVKGYLAESRELTLEQVEGRPYLARVGESAAHLLSPLL